MPNPYKNIEYHVECSYCENDMIVLTNYPDVLDIEIKGWEYDYATDTGGSWTCPDCIEKEG